MHYPYSGLYCSFFWAAPVLSPRVCSSLVKHVFLLLLFLFHGAALLLSPLWWRDSFLICTWAPGSPGQPTHLRDPAGAVAGNKYGAATNDSSVIFSIRFCLQNGDKCPQNPTWRLQMLRRGRIFKILSLMSRVSKKSIKSSHLRIWLFPFLKNENNELK